jgi:hypothetical protein
MPPIFLTTQEAAAHLSISPKTLARWRYTNQGPRVHRFGSAVRYMLEDLIAYAANCTIGAE